MQYYKIFPIAFYYIFFKGQSQSFAQYFSAFHDIFIFFPFFLKKNKKIRKSAIFSRQSPHFCYFIKISTRTWYVYLNFCKISTHTWYGCFYYSIVSKTRKTESTILPTKPRFVFARLHSFDAKNVSSQSRFKSPTAAQWEK